MSKVKVLAAIGAGLVVILAASLVVTVATLLIAYPEHAAMIVCILVFVVIGIAGLIIVIKGLWWVAVFMYEIIEDRLDEWVYWHKRGRK